jgi:protoporphyrinogen oxidase
MHDVVVIGGGVTGLAAAWELQRLGADFVLIELKARLGGSIITDCQGDWCLDGGPFVFERYTDWPWLSELGLADSLIPIGRYRDGELVIFKRGSQVLVDALALDVRARVMFRMAVSSVGVGVGGCLVVCLENGVVLEALSVILAAPARAAAHVLRTLVPEASLLLHDYRYDPVARVSLGYTSQALPGQLPLVTGGLFKFIERYDLASRMPAGHSLVRIGVRLDTGSSVITPHDALEAARALFDAAPVIESVSYWPEADPLTRYLPEHMSVMAMLEAALPASVAVVGSDYRARRLDEQIEHGRAAARRLTQAMSRNPPPPPH